MKYQAKWVTCKNCHKKYTITLIKSKAKESKCGHCGTINK